MRRRYEAVLFVPERTSSSWRGHVVGTYASPAAAIARAEKVLRPYRGEHTRSGSRSREPFVDVRDTKKLDRRGVPKTIATCAPESVLVPSVGELGYW